MKSKGDAQEDLFPEFASRRRGERRDDGERDRAPHGAVERPSRRPGAGPLGRRGRIRVGTSGYSFADWVGTFYPPGTPRNRMLDEYVRHFDVVEINSSYYRVPSAGMFERMEQKTPDGFEFVIKLYKGMTHDIEDDASAYKAFRDAVSPLRDAGKFGGYLAQFPWKFRNSADAKGHLSRLRDEFGDDPVFVEFRHDSWIVPQTFAFLRERGLGYCSVDEPSLKGLVPPLVEATTDTGYVRLHGRNARNWWGKGGGDRYDYDYNSEELGEWSAKLLSLEDKVKKVYAFFNNCHAGHAARNAELMMEMLKGELGST